MGDDDQLTGSGARVLLVEDDRSVRESLERVLKYEGYQVSTCNDGAAALGTIPTLEPDAIVLDVMMPNVDGLTVCRRLRSDGDQTPILLLTARQEVSDRVAGLDAGADDYLPKPFALDELLARVRALLRRVEVPDWDADTVLEVADLQMHVSRRTVTRAGQAVDLTKTEFDLLELLLRNAGMVLDREVIYDRIWGYDFGTSSKSLDVYIGYLRRKTEEGGHRRLIQTVRGVGYVVRE